MTRPRLASLCLVAAACASSPRRSLPPAPASPETPLGRAAAASVSTVPQYDIALPRDTGGLAAIEREGADRSHVADDLGYLSDVIGPRVTGSAGMTRANDWTERRFREYGMDSSWQEAWRFGRGWQRGPMTLVLLAPHHRQLTGASWGWAPGTNGPLAGAVVLVEARSVDEFRRKYTGTLRGAWVMAAPPQPVWNPDGPPMSSRDSARIDSVRRAFFAPPSAEERAYRRSLAERLASEGAAGQILDGGKEHALLTMSGSPSAIAPLPLIVVDHETYAMFDRLIRRHEPVRLEATITNSFTADSVTVHNTVAEIRGSEKPDEVVLLGAHLDSWDLGTGTTDNAAGSIAVLEASRILKASGVRPKRTIRFALFSGEEEGLFGSARYAAAHRTELGKFQTVLVLDNGTGRITGVSLQGRNDLQTAWEELFAPLAALGPFEVRRRNKGGTDHLSFLPYGVPAFNYDQETRGYNHTHHSQADTYDHAVIADVQQAAIVMAATAYQLANLPSLLPRSRP